MPSALRKNAMTYFSNRIPSDVFILARASPTKFSMNHRILKMPTLVSSTLQQNITRSIDESFGAIHINMNK